MSVLILVESIFGNTRAVADAVATGLRAELAERGDLSDVVVMDVAQAPTTIPKDVRLLLLGGPTHAFSMSRMRTRQDALHDAGALATGGEPRTQTGLREWIEAAAPDPQLPVLTFDTRVKVAFVPGSAARSAAKALAERGFEHAERGETFWVEDKPGPLQPGELERASAWGATLAARL